MHEVALSWPSYVIRCSLPATAASSITKRRRLQNQTDKVFTGVKVTDDRDGAAVAGAPALVKHVFTLHGAGTTYDVGCIVTCSSIVANMAQFVHTGHIAGRLA